MRKPTWLSAEDWRAYQQQTAEFKTALLKLLARQLAERKADLHADRDDPNLQRYHAMRIRILQCQIADAEGIASYQQKPARPAGVNADRPLKKRQRATSLLVRPIQP